MKGSIAASILSGLALLAVAPVMAICTSDYQLIESVSVVPSGAGFKVTMSTADHWGTWGMTGCNEAATLVVEYDSTSSHDFLTAILTAQSTAQPARFICSVNCDLRPMPVTIMKLK